MKFALPLIALAGTLIVAAPAVAKQDKDAWKAAKPSGKPESCISIPQIRESRVRDDQTIDFYMRGGKVYRSTLPHSCPSLGFEKRFSYKTSLSQLCSTDIITVLTGPGITAGASCGLGPFQPVTSAPK
ncbi:MAG: hypothetical protein AB7G25_00060 [Sphingomonadaceae bacterium]